MSHFGMALALVLVGSFARCELAHTIQALMLTGGSFGNFCLLMNLFLLSSTAVLPCKMPLLLLGIVGLAATLLDFKEGCVTFPIRSLFHLYHHH